ncbi:unnamed protein product [Tilletia caries]|nr:unnamed protein product [Tilletia caries]
MEEDAAPTKAATTAKLTPEEMDKRPIGAEWMWWRPKARNHFDGARRKLAAERIRTSGSLYGQDLTATDKLIEMMAVLGGEECRANVIYQRVGEAVVIPPGVAQQVRNVRPCFKVAKDLMVPTGVEQMLMVQSERKAATGPGGVWVSGRDATMIRPVVYQAWLACAATVIADDFDAGVRTVDQFMRNMLVDQLASDNDELRKWGRSLENKLAKMSAKIDELANKEPPPPLDQAHMITMLERVAGLARERRMM